MTSTIKVDNIQNQCGGAVVTKCGATTTISGSVVKADDIQAADGGNLINQCGTTITLGASGDTINLASGASQSGFGRTGTVDWQTSIKTATFTAVSGEGYFCNTSGGAFTVNLPSSPSVGDIVAIKDYAGSFDSNNLTIGRGGSNMNGFAADSVRNTANESLTLVYADATKGWLAVEEGTGYVGENFITATGGTVSTSGNCKIHTFTGPGTFSVTSLADCSANNVVAYMVVAGGGGGAAAGAGAGGYREGKTNSVTPYTASPTAASTGLTVTATDFPITVGSGGAQRTNGNNSVFSTITSTGGGGNPQSGPGSQPGNSGGSGAAGFQNDSNPASGGSGNTPPVSPSQGNDGGASNTANASGGGGGAGGSGGNGGPSTADGGAGVTSCISGSPVGRAGGGVGYDGSGTATDGGGVGGGPGGPQPSGGDGSANTGGGGGGGQSFVGGSGGSGIVIIRYKYQ